MNTVLAGTTRSVGARATIVIVAALVLSIAALAVLEATSLASDGFVAWMGNYLAEVGDALAR